MSYQVITVQKYSLRIITCQTHLKGLLFSIFYVFFWKNFLSQWIYTSFLLDVLIWSIYLHAPPVFQSQTYSHFLFFIYHFLLIVCSSVEFVVMCLQSAEGKKKGQESQSE